MKKINLILSLAFFLTISTYAQESLKTSNTNFADTTAINKHKNLDTSQSIDISILGKKDLPQIDLYISLYPIPSSSFVNLKVINYDIKPLKYELFDMNGKLIITQKIASNNMCIELENLHSAIYYLKVVEEGELIKVFRIKKNS